MRQVAESINFKRPFQNYEHIDRSDKYIVCRVNFNYDLPLDENTYFYKLAKHRNEYSAGDFRISFY